MNYIFFTFSIFFSFIVSQVFSQNLDVAWAQGTGGTDFDYSRAMTKDGAENLYVVGQFKNTADFDPGSNTTNLTSNGNSDIFIQKTDTAGNLIWAKSIGGTGEDQAYAIQIDSMGNLGIAGQFAGLVDFDPGSGTTNLNSNGDVDAFILKMDTSGNFIWAKSMGGTGSDQATSIGFDNLGNVYTTGRFSTTVDFDPSSGTSNATSNGSFDVFIQKLDPNGNLIWVKSIGGAGFDAAGDIEIDQFNNAYLFGHYSQTVDFDPNAGVVNHTSNGSVDIFLLKLDPNGNLIWNKNFGGPGNNFGLSITLDHSNHIYTTGKFAATTDFDPGPGVLNHTSNGASDAFVQKLDINGNYVWSKSFGGTSYEHVSDIKLDASQGLYLVGEFTDTVDFDPGVGIDNKIVHGSLGGVNMFVLKLDTAGNYQWTYTAGNETDGGAIGLVVNDQEELFITGYYSDSTDFDPSSDSLILYSQAGSLDFVLFKLSANTITTILPIKITTFDAERIDKSEVELNWKITQQNDLLQFEIERADEHDMNFQQIHVLQAEYSNDYQFIDPNASERTTYYRLKIINTDSEVAYSSTRAVAGISNSSVFAEIYPNPIDETINIRFKQPTEQVSIQVLDITGNRIYDQLLSFPNRYLLQLEELNLSAGVYLIHVATPSGEQLTKKFIKK